MCNNKFGLYMVDDIPYCYVFQDVLRYTLLGEDLCLAKIYLNPITGSLVIKEVLTEKISFTFQVNIRIRILLSPRPTKLGRGDVGFTMSVFLSVCLSVNSLQARVF